MNTCNNYNTLHNYVELYRTQDQKSILQISIHPSLFKKLTVWSFNFTNLRPIFCQSDNDPPLNKVLSYLSLWPASVTHSLLPYDDPCPSYLLWSLYLFFPQKSHCAWFWQMTVTWQGMMICINSVLCKKKHFSKMTKQPHAWGKGC